MKAIKWIGGLQFYSIGALEPGRIVTEAEVDLGILTSWVAQGWAEWYEEPKAPAAPVEAKKKTKIKEASYGK